MEKLVRKLRVFDDEVETGLLHDDVLVFETLNERVDDHGRVREVVFDGGLVGRVGARLRLVDRGDGGPIQVLERRLAELFVQDFEAGEPVLRIF